MGFSLSDLNPVSLVSNAAESLCDVVLPKNLEFVGDLVGLAADIESGNWSKCVDDLQDFAKDLPQQLGELSGHTGRTSLGDSLIVPGTLYPAPNAPPSGQSQASFSTASSAGAASLGLSAQAAKGMVPDAFFGLSDASLMNAVRAGNIPDAVKNDPAQMRRLEARINDITEMNHLITSMLKAMHDMNTQVIQNIRV